MKLYTYLSESADFSNIDDQINSATKEELNASEDGSNCIIAIIKNENLTDDIARFSILKKLIEKGLDLSKADPDGTALVYFSVREDSDAVKYLLENKADASKEGYGAIREAVWYQRPLNLEYLLEKSPGYSIDEELVNPTVDRSELGFTIFYAAIYGFLRDVVRAGDESKMTEVAVDNFTQVMNKLIAKISNTNNATNMLWILLNNLSVVKLKMDEGILPNTNLNIIEDVYKTLAEKLCKMGADPYVLPNHQLVVDVDIPILSAADLAKALSTDDILQMFDQIAADNFKSIWSLKDIAARSALSLTDEKLKSKRPTGDAISYMRSLKSSPAQAAQVHENMLKHKSARSKPTTNRP